MRAIARVGWIGLLALQPQAESVAQQALSFPDHYIISGPETGKVTPDGRCTGTCGYGGDEDPTLVRQDSVPNVGSRCVGSGCVGAESGVSLGSSSTYAGGGTPSSPFFGMKSGAFGPTWANQGYATTSSYLGPSSGPASLNAPGEAYQTTLVETGVSLVPDRYLTRSQIAADLTLLNAMREVILRHRMFAAVPRVNPSVPPSAEEIRNQLHEGLSKNLDPVRAAARYTTDWNWYYRRLDAEAVPRFLDTATSRDIELSDSYASGLAGYESGIAAEILAYSSRTGREMEASVDQVLALATRISEAGANREGAIDGRVARAFLHEPVAYGYGKAGFKQQQILAKEALSTTLPLAPAGGIAKIIADLCLARAEEQWDRGDVAGAFISYELSLAMLDVLLGVLPVVGVSKDIYEFMTETSLVDGRKLSDAEVRFAGFSAISFGVLSATSRSLDVINEIKLGMRTRAISELDQIAANGALNASARNPIRAELSKFPSDVKLVSLRDAAVANAYHAIGESFKRRSKIVPYASLQSPWSSHTVVADLELMEPLRVVRLHGKSNRVGSWFSLEVDVVNRTPEQLQYRFNLPAPPSHVSSAVIPAGTRLLTGPVGSTSFSSFHGARQIFIAPKEVKKQWFVGRPVSLSAD